MLSRFLQRCKYDSIYTTLMWKDMNLFEILSLCFPIDWATAIVWFVSMPRFHHRLWINAKFLTPLNKCFKKLVDFFFLMGESKTNIQSLRNCSTIDGIFSDNEYSINQSINILTVVVIMIIGVADTLKVHLVSFCFDAMEHKKTDKQSKDRTRNLFDLICFIVVLPLFWPMFHYLNLLARTANCS